MSQNIAGGGTTASVQRVATIANLESNVQQSQGELLAKLAANIMCEAESTSGQSSSVVPLGIGMPALPKKLVERIKAGDYERCPQQRDKVGHCHPSWKDKWY